MAMTEERTHMLVLTGDAGIKSARDVADSLLKAIETHARIEVDTQTVSDADVTTVQTLPRRPRKSRRFRAGASAWTWSSAP